MQYAKLLLVTLVATFAACVTAPDMDEKDGIAVEPCMPTRNWLGSHWLYDVPYTWSDPYGGGPTIGPGAPPAPPAPLPPSRGPQTPAPAPTFDLGQVLPLLRF